MAATCTVCLIAKNEEPYLLEWVAHYRLLGFDEIVVYENNSIDQSLTLLKALAAAGKITCRPWSHGAREAPQITAYQDALAKARTDWMLFVDTDEFLVLHEDRNVREFLKRFDKTDVTAIGLNWRVFGDSHLKVAETDRLVTERFTWASKVEFPVNGHIKSFIRVSALDDLVSVHICRTTGRPVHASGKPLHMKNWGISDEIDFDVAQINHYYTKTYAEYEIKKQRGNATVDEKHKRKYTWYHDEAFHGHNRNDVQDVSIAKYHAGLVKEIASLRKAMENPVPTFRERLLARLTGR